MPGGWTLWSLLVGGTGVAALGLLLFLPDYDGIGAALRLTARLSFALFLLAFTASALGQLFPGPPTRWLRTNRRFIGLAFAGSHAIHLAIIVVFWDFGVSAFVRAQPSIGFVANLAGYAVLAAMAATSFGPPRRAIGPGAWSLLHLWGSWFLWLDFAKSYVPRAALDPFYWPFVALLFLAVALRIVAWRWRFKPGRASTEAREAA